jgi:hypothetical protein
MSKTLPSKRDIKFLLAEDIRQEALNKSSLLGLMAGERFAVAGAPPAGAPQNVAIALPSLAFVFVITGGEGTFPGRLKILAPDKTTVVVDAPAEKPLELASGKACLFALTARPFVGPAFGTYSVQLKVDKATFSFPMIIEKGRATSKAK